jgi:hypothetical protein
MPRSRQVKVLALALVALLLVPLVSAGDEANPDITDTQDRTSTPDLDFLAAWFEADPGGIVFTFKVRQLDAPVPNHGAAIGFDFQGERWVAMIGIKADGSLASSLKNKASFATTNSPDKMDGRLDHVAIRTGKPGYYVARIPYAAIPGLAPGAVLQNVGGSSMSYSPAGGWDEIDGTRALDGYAVQRAFLPSGVSKVLPYLAIAALVLLGAAAGYFVVRRNRAASPPAERGEAQGERSEPENGGGSLRLKPPPP